MPEEPLMKSRLGSFYGGVCEPLVDKDGTDWPVFCFPWRVWRWLSCGRWDTRTLSVLLCLQQVLHTTLHPFVVYFFILVHAVNLFVFLSPSRVVFVWRPTIVHIENTFVFRHFPLVVPVCTRQRLPLRCRDHILSPTYTLSIEDKSQRFHEKKSNCRGQVGHMDCWRSSPC